MTRLEMLIERIHEIQQEIPETEENISPEEQAFWKLPMSSTKQWGAAQSFKSKEDVLIWDI